MSMQKARINDRIYDVIPRDKYSLGIEEGNVAVIWNDTLYPQRNKDDNRPGIYSYQWGSLLVHPTEENAEEYSKSNIIDLRSADMKELISKNNSIKEIEKELLTNSDNVFLPPLLDNDTPEMRILKEAVIAKQMDIDMYEPRFGGNFNNDKRLFAKPTITMGKLKTIADNLDMRVTISIEDKNENVPNPIGKVLKAEL